MHFLMAAADETNNLVPAKPPVHYAEGYRLLQGDTKRLCALANILPEAFYYRHHTKDIAEYEEMFQLSLLWGCFPSARIDVNTEEVHDLFLKYKRFLDLLIGKKWVLEKAPFKLPLGWKGNLFKNRGGYVVFAIKDLHGFTTEGSLKISLKTKYCGAIKVTGISGTELAFRQEESGDYLHLEIENAEFVNAVVIEQ